MEIGVEEVPANVMAAVLHQMKTWTAQHLQNLGLPSGIPEVYGTPRRLILHLPGLAPQQAERSERIIGPSKKAAFTAQGEPTPAATGFAKSQQAAVADLQVITTERGEYLAFEKKHAGRSTAALLSEILPEMLAGLTFPKAMRWNDTRVAFVRPIRWIVALYAGRVVPFSFAGVAAGAISEGHRLMAPASFTVSDFASYKKELRRRYVLIDPQERFNLIQQEIARLAKENDGWVEEDEALLWQAAHTVEYPVALCGSYPLSGVPKELIVTAMKEHQGYFPVFSHDGGLIPCFIAIANTPARQMKTIIRGNERVLGARLSDAQFYFEQDRKKRLSDFSDSLQGVTFQEKLGSLAEKSCRLVRLMTFLARATQSDLALQELKRAAYLSKCDLLTGGVREFPSLQGTLGKIYARMDGESEGVSIAIEEQYAPRVSGGALPATLLGQILSVADKCDTLVGCFGVGLIPSGSEDPYALRRQGLGLIQILSLPGPVSTISLPDLVSEAVGGYTEQGKFESGSVLSQVIEFFKQRMVFYLQSQGIRHDLIDATLSREIACPKQILDCARALTQFSKNPLFDPMMTAFKRAMRILPKNFSGQVQAHLLVAPSEEQLSLAIGRVKEQLNQDGTDDLQRFSILATLYAPLNQFFEGVLVMDPNKAVQENRLALLKQVCELFYPFGDFSKISGGA